VRAALLVACAAVAIVAATPPGSRADELPAPPEPWLRAAADGTPVVALWFFWTESCPHCRAARPVVEALPAELPWLDLRSIEVDGPEAAARYGALAAAAGGEARAVPALVYCGRMRVGWDPAETPAALRADLERCRAEAGLPDAVAGTEPRLPAGLDADALSLPLLTIALAGLDAFNPCAFFVLLVLLGLLVHARSRARMLVVGGVFVATSGLVYFALMAAWLNVFLRLGELAVVTTLAGLLAVALGALDVKDFAWPGRGPSRSIPSAARPGLFRRVRALVSAERTGTMLVAAFALALAANAYEALCTAGLPMVYTRLLTLRALPPAQYYGWLALYVAIYVLPLLAIVVAFAWTMGARKLGEREGRLLKLLSGLMMLGLGVLLLAAPAQLGRPLVTALLVGAAVAATALAARFGPARRRADRAA
jgi:thiol-disulfide isomerase/thioredoxin